MAFSLMMVSCTPNSGISSNVPINSKSLNANYSGQQIFEGLFFFQNDLPSQVSQLREIADKVNEARAQNPEADQYMQELAAMTTDYINANYPHFFEDMKATMYSGDYYRIDQVMKQSSKLIEQAILTSEEYGPIYAIGKKVGEDPELVAEIQALDLTNEKDVKKLELLLANVDGIQDVDPKAVGVVAVVAGFYLLAAAVNTVVAAYYVIAAAAVVTKLALWDVFRADTSEGSELSDEFLVAELGALFSKEN